MRTKAIEWPNCSGGLVEYDWNVVLLGNRSALAQELDSGGRRVKQLCIMIRSPVPWWELQFCKWVGYGIVLGQGCLCFLGVSWWVLLSNNPMLVITITMPWRENKLLAQSWSTGSLKFQLGYYKFLADNYYCVFGWYSWLCWMFNVSFSMIRLFESLYLDMCISR